MFDVNGVWGVLILIADIFAIINVVQARISTGKKALWVALIILLPVLGVLIWFFLGPRGRF